MSAGYLGVLLGVVVLGAVGLAVWFAWFFLKAVITADEAHMRDVLAERDR